MPEKKYFMKMGGFLAFGLLALAVAFILFVFLLPYILLIAIGAFMIIGVFIAIWAVVYVAMIAGVGIYYFFKHPMKWEKKDKGYKIDKTKEEGKREKGESKK